MKARIKLLAFISFILPAFVYSQIQQKSIQAERKSSVAAVSSYVEGEYYFESFEGDTIPEGWQTINSIENSPMWVINKLGARTGSHSLFFIEFERTGANIDWLIMPRFTVSENNYLEFYLVTESGFIDSLRIMVSEENSIPNNHPGAEAAFTKTVMRIDTSGLSTEKWARFSVPLKEYAGKKIYIAFRKFSHVNTVFAIDDVSFGEKYKGDITVRNMYLLSPKGGVGAKFSVTAEFLNNGTEAQSFDAAYEVPGAGFINRKHFENVAPDSAVKVQFDSWIPVAAGEYTVKVYSELAGDGRTSDDTLSAETSILENIPGLKWHAEADMPDTSWICGAGFYIKHNGSKQDTGYIVTLGGYINEEIQGVLKYNMINKTWTAAGALIPGYSSTFSSVQIGGKIYITGGRDSLSQADSAMYVYDMESGTLVRGAVMPQQISFYAIGAYADSLVYIIGGCGASATNTVLVYNIKQNTWAYATPFPGLGRWNVGGAICGNKIILSGGYGDADGVWGTASRTEIGVIDTANPYSITWAKGENYPGGAMEMLSAGSWYGKKNKYVIFTGGYNNYNKTGETIYSSAVWIYDAAKDEWFAGPDKKTVVCYTPNLFMVARNDSLYMAALGGNGVNGYGIENEWLYLGEDEPMIGIKDQPVNAPAQYSLSQNYPNPFNPSTKIKYSLREPGHVSLTVYDMLGREIKTLINELMSAGEHEVIFNAGELNLSSGIYLYRIKSGSFVQTKKLLLIK
jgi:hypothetical protein